MISSIVGPVIAEIIIMNRVTVARTVDPTYDYWSLTVLNQIIQCLSVITACWTQLMLFLTWIAWDGLRIQNLEHPVDESNESEMPIIRRWTLS